MSPSHTKVKANASENSATSPSVATAPATVPPKRNPTITPITVVTSATNSMGLEPSSPEYLEHMGQQLRLLVRRLA